MLKPVRTVAPAVTPVSLTEAKAHLVVETADHDNLITALIEAATGYLDGYSGILGRALVNQTWVQKFPQFPGGWAADLELAPVQSITAITYYDGDNAVQTLAAGNYTVLDDQLGPLVTLQVDGVWPTSYAREDAVSIAYVAGYGATGASVPAPIRQAILLMVGHWYENRSAVSEVPFADVPMTVKALYWPYKRVAC